MRKTYVLILILLGLLYLSRTAGGVFAWFSNSRASIQAEIMIGQIDLDAQVTGTLSQPGPLDKLDWK